jgi:hypothetical protein
MRGDPALVGATLGYAAPEDVARATESGFHHHLAKPLDMGLLERILRRDERGAVG